MDFGLSEDQQLLQRTVRDFLAAEVPIERVRELRDAEDPNDDGVWQALVELGVAGILVPETQDGAGLGLLDAALPRHPATIEDPMTQTVTAWTRCTTVVDPTEVQPR